MTAGSSASTDQPAGTGRPPDDWVPVDDRVLGFDRRTLLPGLILLAVWVVWVQVLPAVNRSITFDNRVENGDVVDLGNKELTFVPSAGWNLEDGVRLGEEGVNPVALGSGTALVTEESISFTVQTAVWSGSPEGLLDQVLRVNDALDTVQAKDVEDTIDIVNVDGVPGLLAPYRGSEEVGFVATYVFKGVEVNGAKVNVGVSATVVADPDADESLAKDVVAMLQSIRLRSEPGKEGGR